MIAAFNRSDLSLLGVLLGACLLTQFTGCSKGEDLPDTYPTSGTVTYKDKPVEGATVVFRSTGGEKTHIATGVTDAQGVFELSTFGDKDGAVEGTHTVTVSKLKSDQADSPSLSMEEAAAQKEQPTPKVTSELPEKYSNPSTSDLKAEVKAEDSNDIPLELKD